MTNRSDGPLTGFRILDFTANMSGPFGTMLLGDQGADVVKVEPPSGDPLRQIGASRAGTSGFFANLNRSKRSMIVDLGHPGSRPVIDRLIDSADVVVQNFRPAVAERLGLDAASVRRGRPQVVHAAITGFGGSGPYAGRPVYDHVVQALAGYADIQDTRGSGPALVRHGLVDKASALFMAQAVTAALLQRSRTGQGQDLTVCMLDAALAFLWPDGLMNHTLLEPDTRRPAIAGSFRLTATTDGHVALQTVTDEQWRGLLAAAGWKPADGQDREWTFEERLAHGTDVLREVIAILGTWTTDEVVQAMAAHDVPCAAVVKLDEICHHPQVVANQTVWESTHPQLGPMRQVRPVVGFRREPGELRPVAALGEHTVEVLLETGFDGAEVDRLQAEGVVGKVS